jgi:DNA-binding MarR family transcriptional regulator
MIKKLQLEVGVIAVNTEYSEYYNLLHIMDQTYASLISVSNKLQAMGDQICGDLTSRQFMTLLAVLHLPEEEATMINIANKLGSTKQNTARVIKSLERKKYISVQPSEKDKRAVNVRLTNLGTDAILKYGSSAKVDFMATVFKDFDKDEVEALWKLLIKLYRFDGEVMDGFEENIQIPQTDIEGEHQLAVERFIKKRNGTLLGHEQ